MSTYTARKVYHRLAAKLPAGAPTNSDWVRWSIEGGVSGVAGQRTTHWVATSRPHISTRIGTAKNLGRFKDPIRQNLG